MNKRGFKMGNYANEQKRQYFPHWEGVHPSKIAKIDISPGMSGANLFNSARINLIIALFNWIISWIHIHVVGCLVICIKRGNLTVKYGKGERGLKNLNGYIGYSQERPGPKRQSFLNSEDFIRLEICLPSTFLTIDTNFKEIKVFSIKVSIN
jgi:hypothetical protein